MSDHIEFDATLTPSSWEVTGTSPEAYVTFTHPSGNTRFTGAKQDLIIMFADIINQLEALDTSQEELKWEGDVPYEGNVPYEPNAA